MTRVMQLNNNRIAVAAVVVFVAREKAAAERRHGLRERITASDFARAESSLCCC